MPRRIFLGHTSPFLPLLTAHLLEDRDSLPGTLVIVPTSQSGRLLRESLAAAAVALLAPAVATPGSLLHLDDPSIAPPWLEKIAWITALESLTPADWEKHAGLLPTPPAEGDLPSDWAVSLASEIVGLRSTLQDHLHNLFSASKFLANTPESPRWEALAEIEILAERTLAEWSYQSRSTALRTRFKLPDYERIVLAGVTEMPPCLVTALEAYSGDLTVIIAAPESEKEHFSPLGIPLENWRNRPLPARTATSVAADPEQQSALALEVVSATGASSDEVALGTADDQAGAALARTFTAAGWTAFHPAATRPAPSLVRWLTAWRDWLSKPSTRHLAALLSLPEADSLADGNRAGTLRALNRLRDRNPTLDPTALALARTPCAPEASPSVSPASFPSARPSFPARSGNPSTSISASSDSPGNPPTTSSERSMRSWRPPPRCSEKSTAATRSGSASSSGKFPPAPPGHRSDESSMSKAGWSFSTTRRAPRHLRHERRPGPLALRR